MQEKTVKQVIQNLSTGEVTIEYSDGSTKPHNVDQYLLAKMEGEDLVVSAYGKDIVLPSGGGSSSGVVTIVGDMVVGSILTASMPQGYFGIYQWYRDSTAINLASSKTYTLVQADVGKTISCEVSRLGYTGVSSSVVTA